MYFSFLFEAKLTIPLNLVLHYREFHMNYVSIYLPPLAQNAWPNIYVYFQSSSSTISSSDKTCPEFPCTGDNLAPKIAVGLVLFSDAIA
mmetsp:Transcript_1239/g.2505  ORF Transcript_1239/g.2505 Transcript_1239/m.2505 type:complete len:89 (-) Transcript_1239:561-827(-)